jgi:hypothetical protein
MAASCRDLLCTVAALFHCSQIADTPIVLTACLSLTSFRAKCEGDAQELACLSRGRATDKRSSESDE